MFGYELKSKARKETIDEVLSLIDGEIEELKKLRDEYYVQIEGYAHSKSIYDVSEAMRKLKVVQDRIHDFDLIKTTIKYRYNM